MNNLKNSSKEANAGEAAIVSQQGGKTTRNFKKLISGTDIRGVATADIQSEKITLTDDAVVQIARGFVAWLCEKTEKPATELTISIGRDSRISGPKILALLESTFTKMGISVKNCGLCTTPAMFMTTIDLNADGAVEVTASHHPFNRNGLKFFTKNGGLDHEDIIRVVKFAEQGDFSETNFSGNAENVDYIKIYSERLREMIKREVCADDYHRPLLGFKIAVDAGNGAGGFYAKEVLEILGADVSGSRFLEPDGMFPNHVPNPEAKEAMDAVCEAVLQSGSNLGVIFDTDMDRGAAVDSDGVEINRNRLVALASLIALENNPGGTIVTDSITSSGLTEFIEKNLCGTHCRYMRGYKNVINKALELNADGISCPLAIETSGHAAMKENYFLDDGAYLCTKIIIKMAQCKRDGIDFEKLLCNLKEPAEEKEIRIKIADPDFADCGKRIMSELLNFAKTRSHWSLAKDNVDAVRIYLDKEHGNGWFLLRLSVHDPIMPLNIESDDIGGSAVIEEEVFSFLRTTEGLEL